MTASSNAPATSEAEKQIDPASEHAETMRLMVAWRNGAQPAEEIARRAQCHLERAVRACRERGDFKVGIGIDEILETARALLHRNLVNDACQWQECHVERLRQRLLDRSVRQLHGPDGMPGPATAGWVNLHPV